MTDEAKALVERMRDSFVYDQSHYAADPLIEEAADRIEMLERAVDAAIEQAMDTIEAQATRIEALEAALRGMIDEYVCNVDSFRTGGFYSDPRKDDCVVNAEAALESKP